MYDEFADFKAIAVLGITGGGKSTFIRYATGGSDEIMIGGRLESCKCAPASSTLMSEA